MDYGEVVDDMKSSSTLVGELISAGMSQKRIAVVLGCSQGEVSRWLNCKCIPGGDLMLRLVNLHRYRCEGK